MIDIAKKVIGELMFDLKRLQKDAKTVEAITKEISGYGRRTSTTFKELGRVIDSSMGRVANQYRQHYRNIDNVARTGSRGIVTITKQGHQQVIQDTRTFSRQIETEYKKTNDRINQIARTTAEKPLGVGTKKQQYDNLLKSLGYRADWFVSGAIFYGSIRASNKLLDVISDTEQGMINLQKVMQDQSTDFDKLQNDLMNLGQAYGFLNKEVLDVSRIWAQAGMRQGEIEELTRVTLLNMNVGMMNAEESAKYLLATLKQFNMEVEDSIKVVDMVNEVANNYAVTNKDLMEAVAMTGSVAKNVGLSIEELIGHVTALSESTAKSGNEIGNALKTIYSYIYRPATVNVFERLGVQVREGADGFRNLNEILKDVQNVWKEMTEQQQTELVVSLEETEEAWESLSQAEQMELSMSAAGVRRRNYFISLIESMSTALDATTTAYNSAGSAAKENEKFMESYQKKVDQLTASLQELAVSMGESGLLDVLKENVTTMKILVDWYNEMPDPIKEVTNRVTLLTGAILMLNVAARVFTGQGIFSVLKARTTALASVATGASVATHTLGQSLLFLAKAPLAVIGPFGLAIAAIGTLVTSLITARKETVKQREEMEESLETVTKIKQEYTEYEQQMQNMKTEYNNLTQQLKTLNEGTNEYANVMERIKNISNEMEDSKKNEYEINNQIATILPNVVLEYDKLGNAVRIAWNEVNTLIDKHKELASLTDGLGWDRTPSEQARLYQSMAKYPELYRNLYRREFQQKARAEQRGGAHYVPDIYRIGKLTVETSPGVFQEMTEDEYVQWRYLLEKQKVKPPTRTRGTPSGGGGGGTPSPGGGAGGAATSVSQLLRNELQQLQFYLEATKLPATALGRDLDVLGQTFDGLTEDIKANGLTLSDITKLYTLSTQRTELLRQKLNALAESNVVHKRELENIVRQIEDMVPSYTDAAFTADDLRIAMDKMSGEGRDALKALIQEHNKLTNEIHNTAMEMRSLEREASSAYGTIESLIKEKLAGAYRYQEQIAIDSLKRTQEAEERSLQRRIDNYDRYMQKRIDSIQDEIDAVDELMQKYRDQDKEEDYREQMIDIEDEIAQTKADKRYEFITETGEKILTYDVAKVKELEERKAEIEEEYSRYKRDKALEAEKRKLEDKKKALENERQEQLDAYKREQNDLKEHHSKQMESLQYYWKRQQTQEQIHQDVMRLIEEVGYQEALRLQNEYFKESEDAYLGHYKEMNKIGQKIASQYSSTGGSSSKSKSSGTSAAAIAAASIAGIIGSIVMPKFHTGGIAGSEGLAWVNRDEMIAPKQVWANLPSATKSYGFSRAMGATTSHQYGAVHITVNANDWQQFMRSIPPAIRARIGGT